MYKHPGNSAFKMGQPTISNKQKMANNVKTHEECQICGRMVKRLKDHMKIHNELKQFKCELCEKGFTQSRYLYRHMRTHTGSKPFKCELCEKGFTKSSNLSRHMRIHTGAKPFKCELCEKEFTQSGQLSKHKRSHN